VVVMMMMDWCGEKNDFDVKDTVFWIVFLLGTIESS